VLTKVADVEGEVRRFVSRYVAGEVEKPHVRAARTIDVAASVDAAWARIAPTSPSPTAELITDDLNEAIGEEDWDPA
jgi:hypothetical protein